MMRAIDRDDPVGKVWKWYERGWEEPGNGGRVTPIFPVARDWHGADPDVHASLRKRLRFVEDETMYEYHDVTPLTWGEQFHDQDWVNPRVLELLRER